MGGGLHSTTNPPRLFPTPMSFRKTSQILFIAAVTGAIATSCPAQVETPAARIAKLQKESPDSDQRVLLAKVQVVLDRAGFRPGKIDGLGGEFTQKAADAYNRANNLPQGTLVDISNLESPYTEYTVTAEDLEWIGKTASTPPEQEKLKRMPYADAWEAISEMFHCDQNFFRELNPGLAQSGIVAGTVVRVPDVEPFRMADVTALEKKRQEEAKQRKAEAAASASPSPAEGTTPPTEAASADPSPIASPVASPTPEAPKRSIRLFTRPRMIEVFEEDRLIASFPCTPGSQRVPVPVGTWRVTSNVLMPYFRYDKSVLKDGTRSDNAFNIPPGPNNYVGIVWMGINRPSVGMHGTQTPDQIGRNESSGCIRLANWDAFYLSQLISKGTPVIVQIDPDPVP
jgi:lipoprotein-anchoring transpeptidase ErfK/SrfK